MKVKNEKITKKKMKDFEEVVSQVLFSEKKENIYKNEKPNKREKNIKFSLVKKK